jgi:hypothetical protein
VRVDRQALVGVVDQLDLEGVALEDLEQRAGDGGLARFEGVPVEVGAG